MRPPAKNQQLLSSSHLQSQMATNLYKSGFRRLLKSAQFAFAKDVYAIDMAKTQLRQEFLKNKNVSDPAILTQLSKDVDDIEEMLKFNIVQGNLSQKGNFEVNFKEEHHVTMEAGQENPHGPEITPIDPSYLGRNVTVNKTKASSCQGKAGEPPELQSY